MRKDTKSKNGYCFITGSRLFFLKNRMNIYFNLTKDKHKHMYIRDAMANGIELTTLRLRAQRLALH